MNKDKNIETFIKNALRGKKVPILVLDTRWHALFTDGEKPPKMQALADEVSALLKRQSFLVTDIKDLKRTKKKLIDGIVAGMQDDSEFGGRVKDKQQEFMYEMNGRLADESDELMEIPGKIKDANEDLLVMTAFYCFEKLRKEADELEELESEIDILREQLKEKVGRRADLSESVDHAYSLMHGLLGHDVMNLYDQGKI